jgi:hypothetical protein
MFRINTTGIVHSFSFFRDRMHQPQPPSGSGALLPKRQIVQVSGPTPGQQVNNPHTMLLVKQY